MFDLMAEIEIFAIQAGVFSVEMGAGPPTPGDAARGKSLDWPGLEQGEPTADQREQLFPRICRRKVENDLPGISDNNGADFQQPQSDGAASGASHGGFLQNEVSHPL